MKINLIDKDSDISKMALMGWDADVKGRKYKVYRVDGFVHSIGGRWGNNDYWACPRDEEPTVNNLIEFGGHVVRWGIEVMEHNYIKTKWDETEVRSSCKCLITRNGVPFYGTSAGSIDFALSEARHTLYRLQEHPINFADINYGDEITGRKIFWKEQPAVIRRFSNSTENGDFRLIITAENPEGFNNPCWMDKDEEMEDKDEIVDDLMSPSIYWFRT